MEVTFLTNEDEKRILDQAEAGKLLYTAQTLTDSQKAQARGNIGAVPAGYGWGEQMAAGLPGNDADNAQTTGLYLTGSGTANVPENCKLIFMQAVSGGYAFQTAYCTDGTVAMRMYDHGEWGIWKSVYQNAKIYEKIATITVAPDAEGNLPQYVTFSADSTGNPFKLTDFIIKANAAFVSGNKSTLYMAVNNQTVISNGAVGSFGASCRYFNIFFRQEADGCRRAEYTSSALSDVYFNAQTVVEQSRLIPPMHEEIKPPFTEIKLYTLVPADGEKAWVEGSTFELWGIRA